MHRLTDPTRGFCKQGVRGSSPPGSTTNEGPAPAGPLRSAYCICDWRLGLATTGVVPHLPVIATTHACGRQSPAAWAVIPNNARGGSAGRPSTTGWRHPCEADLPRRRAAMDTKALMRAPCRRFVESSARRLTVKTWSAHTRTGRSAPATAEAGGGAPRRRPATPGCRRR